MKYKKGTFMIIPNKEYLIRKPSEMQAIYFWLCNHSDENGICFPKKQTIAEEAGCSHNTVDKYLSKLVEDGFISITRRKKNNSMENTSNSYQLLIIENIPKMVVLPELVERPPKIGMTPPPNNGSETVSSINSIHLTVKEEPKIEKPKVIKPILGQLPESRGKTYFGRIFTVYKDLFKEKYNIIPTINTSRLIRSLDPLLDKYTELQIAALLIVFFNWHGVSGDDDKEYEKLLKATFNINWFFSLITTYEVFIRNIQGLEFDDENKVREFVALSMNNLK